MIPDPAADVYQQRGAVSAAGEALQMLPASVARWRICTEPNHGGSFRQGGEVTADALIGEQRGHGDARADAQRGAGFDDIAAQVRHTLQIHHHARQRAAGAQPHHQVRTAGQDLRFWPPPLLVVFE